MAYFMRFANALNPSKREYFLSQIQTFVSLGDCSYINASDFEKYQERPHNIMIGNYSSLGWNLTFLMSYNHPYRNSVSTCGFCMDFFKKAMSDFGKTYEDSYCTPQQMNNHHQIIIGNDVWIGRGATIIGGVKIGSGAIVGTNAVIVKDVPPYSIAVGNPMKIIKYRLEPDVIKKTMAIKWWNWDLDKVLENAPIMTDVEKFIEKHYTPELEKIPEENIKGIELQKYLEEGRKIYSFIADFHTPQPSWVQDIAGFNRTVSTPFWKRVISGFCQSDFENSLLIIWTGKKSNSSDLETLNEYIETFKNDAKQNIFIIHSTDDKIFSPYILRNSTHFITTREMISLECMDWLWDTNVKIVSALDDGIFDGEPDVNWNKLFS